MDQMPAPITNMNNEENPKNNLYEGNKPTRNDKKIIYIISLVVLLLAFLLFIIYNFKYNKNKDVKKYNNEENQNKRNTSLERNISLIKERDRRNTLTQNFRKFLELSQIIDSIDNEEIKNKIKYWENISYPYLGIERFAIPMESTISAGKTSTINYILNLKNNLLQIGENITTKFCVIIRDNKEYKKGKIYNVKIEKRAEINKYNFIKADEIKEDPKIFVEKRNKYIEELQNKNIEIKEPELYFIILEIDTGLFEDEFEIYSDLVEFIDIPGLNEIGGNKNFYFRNVLPFIKPNFLFPIIILDADKFESCDVFNVFKELFEPYISKYLQGSILDRKTKYDIENQRQILQIIKKNAIFLINKLNLFSQEERNRTLNKIIKEGSSEFKIDLKNSNNCFIINAKAKNLEVNKYESFLNYTRYILYKGDIEENSEIIDIIEEEFKKDFNFSIPENIDEIVNKCKYKEGFLEFSELIHKKNVLIGKSSKSQNYYCYFSRQFEKLKKGILKLDLDGIQIKNAIKKKIKNSINEFLKDKIFKEILEYLEIDEKDIKEDFIKYINIKEPIDAIKLLHSPVKELKKIGGDNSGINKLNDNFDELIKLLQNKQFIHFLISGPYSSGKSFTLNNIIGYNLYLLETGRDETTNHAFIIRNSNKINLYQGDLIKNKYEYFFEKNSKLASGKDNVTLKIKEINKNWKNFSYIILETPIQIYEDISIKEDLINTIELIDYPGLDTKKAKRGGYINNSLFNIINGFFFLNEPRNQGEGVKEVFKNIINNFIYKESNVDDLENCLFLFTKNNENEQTNFVDLDIKGQILNLIENLKNKEMDMTDIHRVQIKLNSSSIKFAKLSNIDYKKYVDMTDKLNTFENFIFNIINGKIKKIKGQDINTLFQYMDSFIEERFKSKKEKNTLFGMVKSFFIGDEVKKENNKDIIINDIDQYINIFKKLLLQMKFIDDKYILNINEKNKIENYAKKYLSLKTNLKESDYYLNSFYDEFKNKFREIMNYSERKLNKKFNNYLNQIISETQAVIETINSKFNMNQTEFKKKYSEKVKENIINNIKDKFEEINLSLNAEVSNMKSSIKNLIQYLDCMESDPDIFEYNFLITQQNITNKIEDISQKIHNYYRNFQKLITDLINDFKTDENEKYRINTMEAIGIDKFFRNINFEKMNFVTHVVINIFGFFVGYAHDYKKDIINTCNSYENMIYSAYQKIEDNLKDNFNELNNKGIEVINLIFNTATSNFETLKKNLIKYDEIKKRIHEILKNIHLEK